MSTEAQAGAAGRFAYSTDPERVDWAPPAYRYMADYWRIVEDVREGPLRIRDCKEQYLPRFEFETECDWKARVLMTFPEDHYGAAIEESVGLAFSEPPALAKDFPPGLQVVIEDFDGDGNHFEVFSQTAFDAALHFGHVAILTDYPTDDVETSEEQRRLGLRAYATLYPAPDVLNPTSVVIGGVRRLVGVVLRESVALAAGSFGERPVTRYRHIQQEVLADEESGRVVGLGGITVTVYEQEGGDAPAPKGPPEPVSGIGHIPLRVVYGGHRLGYYQSRPAYWPLAFANVEETQVKSEYAANMHKCNVITPVFKGRKRVDPHTGKEADTVQMGQGIDLPSDGSAEFLEPAGTSLTSTRARLGDIRAAMRRYGAVDGSTDKVMTAAESWLRAKQRNAKILRAVRSLQDGLEGVVQDMAEFMRIDGGGGSIQFNQNFTGQSLEPAYLAVLHAAWDGGALPLEDYLFAVKTGRLPDGFDAEDAALRAMTDSRARREMEDEGDLRE